MFTGVCCVFGGRTAERLRYGPGGQFGPMFMRVGTTVRPPQEIRNPKRTQMSLGSAVFWQLWWACPAGALGAVVQEAGEGGGEIRQHVCHSALQNQPLIGRSKPATLRADCS